MTQTQFFVVLPSNSSMKIYPDNRTSSFTVNLPKPLELDPAQWDVALSEIQYPHIWYNIRRNKNIMRKRIYDLTLEELNILYPLNPKLDREEEIKKRKNVLALKPGDSSLSYEYRIELPIGYYTNVDTLLTHLRDIESNTLRPISYERDELSQKVTIKMPRMSSLDLNNSDIALCLGLSPNIKIHETYVSEQVTTTNANYNYLCIL